MYQKHCATTLPDMQHDYALTLASDAWIFNKKYRDDESVKSSLDNHRTQCLQALEQKHVLLSITIQDFTGDKKLTGSTTIFILLMTNGQLKVLLNVPMTLMYLSWGAQWPIWNRRPFIFYPRTTVRMSSLGVFNVSESVCHVDNGLTCGLTV